MHAIFDRSRSLSGPRPTRRRIVESMFLSARATAPIFPADCGRYRTNANFAGDAILWLCGNDMRKRKDPGFFAFALMTQRPNDTGKRTSSKMASSPFCD